MYNLRKYLTYIAGGIWLLAGCSEEPRARSVLEFLDNPIMLEAAMVRCSQDRQATRYDAECVNAREAVNQIEVKEEAIRQKDFEARSASKRQALRRTQEAAAQARRRAAELESRRVEAEYLAQFGVAMPAEEESTEDEVEMGNMPTVLIPKSEQPQNLSSGPGDVVAASDGGNAPVSTTEPDEDGD